MLPEIAGAVKDVRGSSVAKPLGTLAGHAAGLPFEDKVHAHLLKHFPGRCYRHFEALNEVLVQHPESSSAVAREAVLGAPGLRKLVTRGPAAMAGWSPQSPFEVKQDDTAESIIFPSIGCDFLAGDVVLLDVKTVNTSKAAQAPNIISAVKLAESLSLCLEGGGVPFDIVYVGVAWSVDSDKLVAEDVCVRSLFKIGAKLYINWAAATQVQFHPFKVDQEYSGTREEWARRYLRVFSESLTARLVKNQQLLDQYKKYL